MPKIAAYLGESEESRRSFMIEHSATFSSFLSLSLIILSVFLGLAVLRAITGKSLSNMALGVSMSTTLVVLMILIYAVKNSLDYLIDISLLFALLSIFIVEILTRVLLSYKNKDKEGE